MIKGKLNATDNTKPILIASLASDGLRLSSIFPENGLPANATYPKTPTKIYTKVHSVVADLTYSFILSSEMLETFSNTSKSCLSKKKIIFTLGIVIEKQTHI